MNRTPTERRLGVSRLVDHAVSVNRGVFPLRSRPPPATCRNSEGQRAQSAIDGF